MSSDDGGVGTVSSSSVRRSRSRRGARGARAGVRRGRASAALRSGRAAADVFFFARVVFFLGVDFGPPEAFRATAVCFLAPVGLDAEPFFDDRRVPLWRLTDRPAGADFRVDLAFLLLLAA